MTNSKSRAFAVSRRHAGFTLMELLVVLAILGLLMSLVGPRALDIEEHSVWVIIEYPNASPAVIERTILRPVEETLASLQGLRGMWSTCDHIIVELQPWHR